MTCIAFHFQVRGRSRGAFLRFGATWILSSASFFGVAISSWADRLTGEVVGVTDGDTLTLLDARAVQHKVRLAAIDAPERRQAFGNRARQALSAAVFRTTVTLDWTKRDHYGRLVAKVLRDGRDVGLDLVTAGLAWHYKAYQREQTAADRREYAAAEVQARARRAGLWVDQSPIPPWVFRRSRARGDALESPTYNVAHIHSINQGRQRRPRPWEI